MNNRGKFSISKSNALFIIDQLDNDDILQGLAGQHCRTVAHLAGGGFIYTGN